MSIKLSPDGEREVSNIMASFCREQIGLIAAKPAPHKLGAWLKKKRIEQFARWVAQYEEKL